MTRLPVSGARRARHGAEAPEAAWRNGTEASAKGELFAALRWLDRAARLAPDDARIALDLANTLLRAGGTERLHRAAAAFEALSAGHDVTAAWLGLLAARRLLGEHEAAAAALGRMLARHCLPEEPGFRDIASAVAAAVGAPGWCGISADGRLRIGALGVVMSGEGRTVAENEPVPEGAELALTCNGRALLGSPLRPGVFQRYEAVVETAGAALSGWVSRPAAPLSPPWLLLRDAGGRQRNIMPGPALAAQIDAPLTLRYGFRCPASTLRGLTPPFHVIGPDGADIPGSPIDPGTEKACLPVPAAYVGRAARIRPERAALALVVPVYRGLAVTRACLEAAFQALPAEAALIVVDDAAPEPELAAWLDRFCREAGARLIRHGRNQGFPAAANSGLAAAEGRDALLLNSDTLLPPGAAEALQNAVYAQAGTGSATPLSNEATICSYPSPQGGNPAPDVAGTIALNAMAAAANGGETVEIPTGVGFCLMMRHDCLADTGLFRPELFAQGYGEEVDWCLRARHRGWRHVAATGVYVAHLGKTSFGAAARALNSRNGRLLSRLYPGYDRMVAAHVKADPLRPARRRLDAARFAAGRRPGAVLLISHGEGGGVAKRIDAEMREIRAGGRRPILLSPATEGLRLSRHAAAVTDAVPADYPNLRFGLPAERAELLRLLREEGIAHVVLHHGLGHHPGLRRIAQALGRPQDIVVHDYASFCPRVHLIGPAERYCGEPDIVACASCVAVAGDATGEKLGPARLRARSAREFAAARRVLAPSADAAKRIGRHFPGVKPHVTPWEDDLRPLRLIPPGGPGRRILVPGGIGIAKGFAVLLACALDAGARNLPLEFVVVGSSCDDAALLETGRVFITGAYPRKALPELLAGQQADLAFIPSIWPETWCYTLSEAWEAGLYTAAFALGAQAERIAATGRGLLLPLGLPTARINDTLLAWRA